MNRERLMHARSIMEYVRDSHLPFNIMVWFMDDDFPEDCGTAACFWGWCARDPKFREQGVSISSEGFVPEFKGVRGTRAAAEFFDLSLRAAAFLTIVSNYDHDDSDNGGVTPQQVIDHIDLLLSGKGPR